MGKITEESDDSLLSKKSRDKDPNKLNVKSSKNSLIIDIDICGFDDHSGSLHSADRKSFKKPSIDV